MSQELSENRYFVFKVSEFPQGFQGAFQTQAMAEKHALNLVTTNWDGSFSEYVIFKKQIITQTTRVPKVSLFQFNGDH